MSRRHILTERQRRTLLALPTEEPSLLKHYTHHALKNALRIGRQGEIRDRTSEAQHYRMAGLNLLAAIVIYWNTVRLGEAVRQRKRAGLAAHVLAPSNVAVEDSV